MFMNFENYESFLNILMQDIEAIFEHQKDFIFCKKGCTHCCQNGEYPFTEIEFKYLLQAFKNLNQNTKDIITNNIKNLKQNEQGYYSCPFLINNSCSVYQQRGLVCRTFGLLIENASGKIEGPFCGKLGLNYSNIYDKETKLLQINKIENNEFKKLPKAFKLDISNIINLSLVKDLDLEFGEQKSLLQWLEEYEHEILS